MQVHGEHSKCIHSICLAPSKIGSTQSSLCRIVYFISVTYLSHSIQVQKKNKQITKHIPNIHIFTSVHYLQFCFFQVSFFQVATSNTQHLCCVLTDKKVVNSSNVTKRDTMEITKQIFVSR